MNGYNIILKLDDYEIITIPINDEEVMRKLDKLDYTGKTHVIRDLVTMTTQSYIQNVDKVIIERDIIYDC